MASSASDSAISDTGRHGDSNCTQLPEVEISSAILRCGALATHHSAVLDVDLSACTFLDCSGIRVLLAVHAAAQAAGCRMWARYPQRLVRLVLEVTNLLAMLTAADEPAVTATSSHDDTGPTSPSRNQRVPTVLAIA